jgi:hypothetical protein
MAGLSYDRLPDSADSSLISHFLNASSITPSYMDAVHRLQKIELKLREGACRWSKMVRLETNNLEGRIYYRETCRLRLYIS